MNLAFYTILFVVFFFGILFSFWPLVASRSQSSALSSIDDLDQLLQHREMLLTNLKDLESDLSFKKIDLENYEEQKTALLVRAAEVYSRIEKLEGSDPLLLKMEEDSRAV